MGTTIQTGSVIMIIQMQGGTINGNDASNYGDGTGRGSRTNTAGYYEFNIVKNIQTDVSTLLELILPFENTYSSADNSAFQVVTVPLCYYTKINDNIDATPWNGKTGGIISLLSYNDITVDSKIISASNNGFRGANDYDDPMNTSPHVTKFLGNSNKCRFKNRI